MADLEKDILVTKEGGDNEEVQRTLYVALRLKLRHCPNSSKNVINLPNWFKNLNFVLVI